MSTLVVAMKKKSTGGKECVQCSSSQDVQNSLTEKDEWNKGGENLCYGGLNTTYSTTWTQIKSCKPNIYGIAKPCVPNS